MRSARPFGKTLPVTVALLACVGACADGSRPPGSVDPDMYDVTITLDPTRTVYQRGQTVTPSATFRDEDAQEVEATDVTWMVAPAGAADEDAEGQWTFALEGLHTFTVCAEVDGATVCGDREVRVDDEPPALEITSPLPGEEVDGEVTETVTVAGTLTDANPASMLKVFVNGDRAGLEDDGTFSADVTPEFGINHLVVEASDEISPLAREELDFLWAPGFVEPNPGTTEFDFTDALILRIGQKFFDDAVDLDLAPDGDGNVTAEDLADILVLVLQHADLQALVPNPVIESSSMELSVTDVAVEDVGVMVDVTDPAGEDNAGLALSLDIRDAVIDTAGWLDLGGDCTAGTGADCHSLEGTLRTRVHVDAALELFRDGGTGEYTAEVTATEVDLLNPTTDSGCTERICGTFIDPDVDALFSVVSSDLYTTVRDLMQDELILQLTDMLPSLLSELLLSIEGALGDLSFTLDTGLAPPLDLALQAHIESIDTEVGSAGHLTAFFDAVVAADGTPVHEDSLGAARADVMPMPPFTSLGRLQIAIGQDVINGLLHSLWNAGLLDVDVDFSGITATVAAKLPPVVRNSPVGSPCLVDGEPCDVVLQLGQLEVTAAGQTFAIHAEAGARVSIADGGVQLLIGSTPELMVWQASEGDGALDAEFVETLVETMVWPMLFDSLGSGLTLPLPLPNLADLGIDAIAPALADGSLTLTTDRRLDVESGYLGLVADLSLVAPAP